MFIDGYLKYGCGRGASDVMGLQVKLPCSVLSSCHLSLSLSLSLSLYLSISLSLSLLFLSSIAVISYGDYLFLLSILTSEYWKQ